MSEAEANETLELEVVDPQSEQSDQADASAEAAASGDQTQVQSADNPQQHQLVFAKVEGEPLTELPQDLYIPPEALEVILEAFEGPLDLLLYLIKRQNLDILNINVAEITRQYTEYIELMDILELELAAEYLVMAAMLAEIKSRSLLPRHENAEEDETDPRTELIRRLQEYERFKQAAEDIDDLPRVERNFQLIKIEPPIIESEQPLPDIEMKELMLALAGVLNRAEMFTHHHVEMETISTREKMAHILDILQQERFVPFISLFTVEEGKLGVVVSFMAVLELIKESLIDIVQHENFGPIHVKARLEEPGLNA